MQVLREDIHKRFFKSAKSIAMRIPNIPLMVVVAGSGIAESIDENTIVERIPYSDITNMPYSTVKGHKNELLFCKIRSKTIGIFSGRFHFYEGRSIEEVASQAIISYMLGTKNFVLTNSAGGLSPQCKVGDLMIIEDVINLTFKRPHNIFNPIYFGLSEITSNVFDYRWSYNLKKKMVAKGVPYEEGIYLGLTGPSYETAAEIKFLRKLHAHAVGMSTVIEAHAAKRLQMNVLGASLITNTLKEVTTDRLDHSHVIDAAKSASEKIWSFIETAVETIPEV